MLRLALLENLRRVAARIAIDRIDENLANYWADKMIETAEKEPKNLVLVIADMARSNFPMESAFVATFSRKLQWKGSDLSLPLTWLEQHLAENGLSTSAMIFSDNQKQAADQVSMSNSIGSLRFLAKTDWREFVETMSVVEQTLKQDAAGIYSSMDFYTRDNYRHSVEKLAKKSNLSENEVAKMAVALAKKNTVSQPEDVRKSHVGYYLVGKGIEHTEKIAKAKNKTDKTVRHFIRNNKGLIYFSSIIIIAAAIIAGLTWKIYYDNLPKWLFIITIIVCATCASQLAIALVNWFLPLYSCGPKPCHAWIFSEGIPSEFLKRLL